MQGAFDGLGVGVAEATGASVGVASTGLQPASATARITELSAARWVVERIGTDRLLGMVELSGSVAGAHAIRDGTRFGE
jgi:hypothetical protein